MNVQTTPAKTSPAKAIAAAVLGAAGTAGVAIQAAVTDGSITSAEWGTIGIAALTALASAVGVYQVTNKPVATRGESSPPSTTGPTV